jgi:hypothetical protein
MGKNSVNKWFTNMFVNGGFLVVADTSKSVDYPFRGYSHGRSHLQVVHYGQVINTIITNTNFTKSKWRIFSRTSEGFYKFYQMI